MKRWALRICLFLLLGSIVNIAVAWGLAFQTKQIRITSNLSRSSLMIEERGNSIAGRTDFVLDMGLQPSGVQHDWCGWPMDGFQSTTRVECTGTTLTAAPSFGFIVKPGQYVARTMTLPVVLPMKPVWPGFAVNTVFYAGVLWFVFAGPFVLRRRIRIKRALCPKCAYPVGASNVCTECGASVKRLNAA